MKIHFYKNSVLKAGRVRHYLLLAWLMAVPFAMFAQQKNFTLRGNVKDANGALPGVTVLVEGTSNGTSTDADGNYSLSVSTDQTSVQVSYTFIGYGSQVISVTPGSQETVVQDVTMSETNNQLDEVVVTGSTLHSAKRELGNSISTVTAQQLQNSGSNNLFGSLQGKLPGAQITQNSGDPSGGMTIRLRGVKSLQGNSDPLYVIDGVISSNATTNVSQSALNGQTAAESLGNNRMVDINPADIESINVINGAAAAAQYGTRAANGVVLITTKRGKSGGPQITFTTSYNVNELRKKVPITTYGKQFGAANLRLHTIAAITPAQFASIGTAGGYVPTPGETFTPITRDGVGNYLRSNLVDVTRYDYQDQIFRTGNGTDNNISLSGGSDKTQYFASFGYLKNEGIIKGTDFTRYNFRVRLDHRLASWAKLSAGISYSNSFSNEKANGNVFYSPINSMWITNNIYDITKRDANGKLQAVEPTRVNPLSTIEDMNFTQAVSRTTNNLQLNLTPLKGLGIDWVIGVDTYTQNGRSLINAYPYQATAGLPPERYPDGFAANASNTVLLFNNDINISYERQLTDDLKLTAIAGTSYQYSRSELQQASGRGLAPFIQTVSGAQSTTVVAGYGLDQFNLSGNFIQGTFGYKNLAFLTGAVRQDRSSKFSPGEATQTFPKLSGSFVVSDLGFWKEGIGESVFNTLKLRASYGQAGNFTGIGSYDRFWQFNPVPYLGKNTIVPSSQLANQNVKPERMTEVEFGADMGFMKNRINLGVAIYNQRVQDLVVNRTLAASSGGTSIVNNVGEMENNGVEISLGITAIRTANFNWDMNFIYTRNRNKVTKLGSPTVPIATVSGAPVYLIEGAPASVFYGTTIAKDASGNPLLTPLNMLQSEKGTQSSTTPLEYVPTRDGAGQPTGANIRSVIGNPNPNWIGSWSNNLTYKNLSFNFLFDCVQGIDVFNADKRTRQGVGIGDYVEQEMKGTLPRGYVFALYNTEQWRVDNGSFVKLREVGLSYNFKSPIKGVNSATLGVSGRNLVSWDSYNGFDPETNSGGNSDIVRGVDFGNVPIPRTYKVQLTVRF